MGRAPCCDKANVKKGPWSPEEDAKLKSYIEKNGTGGNWIALPQKIGLKRCGKSCRLRWLNYLRPNIKHGGFSEEEDNIICSLYISIGSRWSIIAAQLPGRTDNDIKNYWNTRLKKKLLGKQRKEAQARRGNNTQKQEMKRGRGKTSITFDNHNQTPYWPEPPLMPNIPYSNQELHFNDHASIRKLLIKLGGKFSTNDQPINGETNLQFPMEIPSYQHSINSTVCESANLQNTQYGIDATGMPLILQGGSSFSNDQFEEMVYNNPQRLNGLEFLYEEMMNNRNGNSVLGTTTCAESNIDWGEMSSLVYTPFVSNYELGNLQEGTLQECGFEGLRYHGTQ
ncbi:hypothetical protein LguiB_017410 [Lonicera macranthoides]